MAPSSGEVFIVSLGIRRLLAYKHAEGPAFTSPDGMGKPGGWGVKLSGISSQISRSHYRPVYAVSYPISFDLLLYYLYVQILRPPPFHRML